MRPLAQGEEMKTVWWLISVNHDGSISYMREGSYHELQKLNTDHFYRVTSITDPDKAKKRFGINR